jgi:hypothetical protein
LAPPSLQDDPEQVPPTSSLLTVDSAPSPRHREGEGLLARARGKAQRVLAGPAQQYEPFFVLLDDLGFLGLWVMTTNIPKHLQSTFDLLTRAFGPRIEEQDYFALLAFLGEHMCEENIGIVIGGRLRLGHPNTEDGARALRGRRNRLDLLYAVGRSGSGA